MKISFVELAYDDESLERVVVKGVNAARDQIVVEKPEPVTLQPKGGPGPKFDFLALLKMSLKKMSLLMDELGGDEPEEDEGDGDCPTTLLAALFGGEHAAFVESLVAADPEEAEAERQRELAAIEAEAEAEAEELALIAELEGDEAEESNDVTVALQ